ncbi:DUF2795 domain-containing protein [Pseudonocardia sp.]|uniref:DUF2795 domain-containing protein n=1 Tax=Pseudonocardia sp. TaxID=60912 RepID=UPI00260DCBEE|nr:DUF2795 domain-containing protein [Pseudonocardia sp.]
MRFQVIDVQRALAGARYPMDGPAMADIASSNGADPELVEILRPMRTVEGPDGVLQEMRAQLGGGGG